jgi:regulator of protease activity HflC (stomatin/prohibitin superfamily)
LSASFNTQQYRVNLTLTYKDEALCEIARKEAAEAKAEAAEARAEAKKADEEAAKRVLRKSDL